MTTDLHTPHLGRGADVRRATIDDDFRAIVHAIFAKFPRARSVMLGFAQYWNDEADDAVHDHLIASERETPLWPHVCDVDDAGDPDDPDDPARVVLAGDFCWNCTDDFPYMSIDDNGDAIAGFAAFCREGGSQDENAATNYRPYAIARRTPAGELAIELVSGALRTAPIGAAAEPAAPFDARAETLVAEVAAHPADDGPRQVLADHLIERGDSRGELIALALAPQPLPLAAREQYGVLLATHAHASLGIAAEVIVADGARFARGFLCEATIYAEKFETCARVREAPAWRTLEILRYRPESLGILDDTMHALREVHAMQIEDLDKLVGAPRPWAIETLGCWLVDDDADTLARAQTLPALRHLRIGGDDLPRAIAALARAPFWPQLAQVTLVADELVDRPELASIPRVGWGPNAEDDEQPAGWHQTLVRATNTLEIALAGWNATASIAALAALVDRARTRGYTVKLVASRCWDPAGVDPGALTRSGR